MKAYGRSAVSEFLGDRIVYRNLKPLDERLPGLDSISREVGLPAGLIPRKSEPEYARVITHLLGLAREIDAPGTRLERLIFVGDTRLLDATAFTNLCQAGGWPGLAFIASENDKPQTVEILTSTPGLSIYLANRWPAIADFDEYCSDRKFPIDEKTVVLVDLDKTALGARGRNAHVIDQARVQAVQKTVSGLLGDQFDLLAFQTAYEQLNQVEFHPFTADNQDYLAYICLILGSGLYSLAEVMEEVRSKRLASFRQFIDRVDARSGDLPQQLAGIHTDIYSKVLDGDPTPFKSFRRNEYLTTIGRMGTLDDLAPVEAMLAEEIVITQEVRSQALDWLKRGALLFGLSDKPDEASLPDPDLMKQGYSPIHRTETHAVGAG